MKTYAILLHPGHNRVYFEEAKRLSINELEIVGARLSTRLLQAEVQTIAGVSYVTFETAESLSAGDLAILGHLSFLYALFERDGSSLLPVELPNFRYMDPDLSSMLKYTGKTNELFTRMLLNIALYSSDRYEHPRLCVLDPIAGKGTTLFEALSLGFDAAGIEIGDKVVAELSGFFKKYLEREKYKFRSDSGRISGPNRSFTAKKTVFHFSRNKEEQKNGLEKELALVAGNSVYTNAYFKKNSFELIVGDLPYGIQHGNVTNESQSSLTRNPRELLAACLPAWRDVLVRGGILALSWNSFVLSREEMIRLLGKNGFSVLTGGSYDTLEHRVDQAIRRDAVVARKL